MRIFILMLGLAVLVAGCGRGAPAPPSTPPVEERRAPERGPGGEAAANTVTVEEGMLRDLRITTAAAEARSDGDRLALLGELEVDQRAYAEVTAPAPARIVGVLVNSGDAVRRGSALAELASADLGRARAEYLSESARVRLAEGALARKRVLATERIAPAREVEQAEADLAEAQASLRATRAAILAYGEAVPTGDTDDSITSSFTLRSPMSGTVIERVAVVGQTADPGAAMFRIGDLSRLWMTVHAFERDAVRIQPGTLARVTFAALPGEDFGGVVRVVGRQVEPQSRTVDVRIDLRNTGGRLRPGMSGGASLPSGAAGTPIVTVPTAAVQRVRDAWCVFIPRAEGRFQIRPIGRGRDLPGEVEILSGLRAGETVVVDGAFLLKAQAEQGAADHDEH